jgi:hypothetical protein
MRDGARRVGERLVALTVVLAVRGLAHAAAALRAAWRAARVASCAAVRGPYRRSTRSRGTASSNSSRRWRSHAWSNAVVVLACQ